MILRASLLFSLVTGLALLPSAAGPGLPLPAAPTPLVQEVGARVEQEVLAFLTHYIETLESREPGAIEDLFVDDERFAWYTDGTLAYRNAADVLAGMDRYRDLRFETQLANQRVVPLGPELASARSEFETRLTMAGAPDVTYGGVITWLLERQGETWRVLLGHTSTPAGPPGAEAGAGTGR